MRLARRSWPALFVLSLSLASAQQTQEKKLRPPDVIFVPTPENVVQQMIKLAGVHKGDVVYDLGCGDGRTVIDAARIPGVRGVGIDINPKRIEESVENARAAGVADRVAFRNEDLFEASIKDATVVMLYLLPSLNLKLRPRLWSELKPGTRIVSHDFDMGDWAPDKRVDLEGHTIYLWTIKSRPAQYKLSR
jgi:SAM-dependent methyltransferase